MKRTTSKNHLRMTLHKNLYRTIRHSYKRFFAIMLMTLLGASVLLSLVSTGPNMRLAVQQPIQSSYREDLRIHSPLGLEPEDTLYLSSLEQVARWEAYKQADYLLGDTDRVFRLQSLSSAVSLPELVSGRLPASSQEIVLDAALMKHYSIGDPITLNKPDTDEDYSLLPDHTLQHPTMTVVGFVHHIHYLAASRYGTSQVGDGTVDAFGFTTPDNFKEDTVDGVMLRIKGLDVYNTHDALYEQHILQWTHDLESHFKARTKHRTAKTIDELQEKIQDSEEQIENGEQALQEGEQKLSDAYQELEKNQQEWSAQNQSFQNQMADAEKELQDKQRLIEEKQSEWDDGQNKLNSSLQVWQDKKNSFDQKKAEWEASYSSLEDGEKELQEAEAAFTQFGIQPIATETLDSMLQAIQRSIDSLEEQLERIREALLLYPDDPALQEQYAILEEQVQALESKAEQLESMRPQIEIYLETKESLAQARTMLEAAKSQLDAAEEQLQEGKAQLDAQQQRLDEAKQSLEQGQQAYTAAQKRRRRNTARRSKGAA